MPPPKTHNKLLAKRSEVSGAWMNAQPGFEALEPRLLLSAAKPQEVEMVWLLNQARANPRAYAKATNQPAEVRAIAPQTPLVINAALTKSARAKSAEMAKHDYFAHQSQLTGLWPNQIASSSGYNLAAVFPQQTNSIESLYGGYPSSASQALEALVRDKGIDPPGHRIHLLATNDFFAEHDEIGVGYARNRFSELQNYFTVHTAYSDGEKKSFFTGVVYKDQNKNKRYDAGEGVRGVKVMINGKREASTRKAGDYRIAVEPGRHKIAFVGKSFTEKKTKRKFTVTDKSIAYDAALLRGNQKTYVNFKGTRFVDSKPLPVFNPANGFVFQAKAGEDPLIENNDRTVSVLPVAPAFEHLNAL